MEETGRQAADVPWPPGEARAFVPSSDPSREEEPESLQGDGAVADSLTGLSDRVGALQVLQQYQSHAWETGVLFSVILLDVDSLGSYNQRHGREAGDALLVRLADLLRAWIRRSDLAARWSGEEFLIALRGASPAVAAIVAERLRLDLTLTEGVKEPVTVSMGIATWRPDMPNVEALVAEAERALALVKKRGGNGVEISTSSEAA